MVSSVVQGSCLGPCLFVILINDIDLAVDELSFIIKFADDSKAGRVVDCQEDREIFQQMLDSFETWSQAAALQQGEVQGDALWQTQYQAGVHHGGPHPRIQQAGEGSQCPD